MNYEANNQPIRLNKQGKSCKKQKKVINRLLDVGQGNFEGYLAAKNYRTLTKTTRATASRDIDDLLKKHLKLLEGGGRSTRYDLYWEKFATFENECQPLLLPKQG